MRVHRNPAVHTLISSLNADLGNPSPGERAPQFGYTLQVRRATTKFRCTYTVTSGVHTFQFRCRDTWTQATLDPPKGQVHSRSGVHTPGNRVYNHPESTCTYTSHSGVIHLKFRCTYTSGSNPHTSPFTCTYTSNAGVHTAHIQVYIHLKFRCTCASSSAVHTPQSQIHIPPPSGVHTANARRAYGGVRMYLHPSPGCMYTPDAGGHNLTSGVSTLQYRCAPVRIEPVVQQCRHSKPIEPSAAHTHESERGNQVRPERIYTSSVGRPQFS